MEFTKMQGIGNDYVYVDCFKEKVEHPGEVSKYVSDRHFGIGADGLVYQDLGDLKRAVMDINPEITSLDSSCFDGVYVTGDIDADYLERLNSKHKKKEKASSGTGLQLNMGFKDNN